MMKVNMEDFNIRRKPSSGKEPRESAEAKSPFARVAGGRRVNAIAENLAAKMTHDEITAALQFFDVSDSPSSGWIASKDPKSPKNIGSHGRNRILYGDAKDFEVVTKVPDFLMSAHLNRMRRNGALSKPLQNTPQLAYATGLTLMLPITRQNAHEILTRGELTVPLEGLEGAFNAFSHGEPSLDRDVLAYLAVPARYFLYENSLRFGDKRRTGDLMLYPPRGHKGDLTVSLQNTDLWIVADAQDMQVWMDILTNMSGLKEDLADFPPEHQRERLMGEVLTDFQRWNKIGSDDRPEISRLFLEDYVTGGKDWCTTFEYENDTLSPKKQKSISVAKSFFDNSQNHRLYYTSRGEESKATDKGGVQLTVLRPHIFGPGEDEVSFEKIYPTVRPFSSMAYSDTSETFTAKQLNSVFDAACLLKQAEINSAIPDALQSGKMMMSVSPSYLSGDDYWYDTNRMQRDTFYQRRKIINVLYPAYFKKREQEYRERMGLPRNAAIPPNDLRRLRREVDKNYILRNYQEISTYVQDKKVWEAALESGLFEEVAEEATRLGGPENISNAVVLLDAPDPAGNVPISWAQFALSEDGTLPEDLGRQRGAFARAAQMFFRNMDGSSSALIQEDAGTVRPLFSEEYVTQRLQVNARPDMERFRVYWQNKANRLARDAGCAQIAESGKNQTYELLHGLLNGLKPSIFPMTPLARMPDLSAAAEQQGLIYGRDLPLPSGERCRKYSELKIREFEKRALYAVQNQYLRDLEHRKEIIEFLDRAYENPSEVVNVDHLVPLNSAFVLGFNHLDNYAVISSHDNRVKSNRYWPDMGKCSREDYVNMLYDLHFNGHHQATELHRAINNVCLWNDRDMIEGLYGKNADMKWLGLDDADLACMIENHSTVLDFVRNGAASVGMISDEEKRVTTFRRDLMTKIKHENFGRNYTSEEMLQVDPDQAAAFWNNVMDIRNMSMRSVMMALSTMRWHSQFEQFYEQLDLSDDFVGRMERYNVRSGEIGHRNGLNRLMQHMDDFQNFEPMVAPRSLVMRMAEKPLSPETQAIRKAVIEWTNALTRAELAEQQVRMKTLKTPGLVLNQQELAFRIQEMKIEQVELDAAEQRLSARNRKSSEKRWQNSSRTSFRNENNPSDTVQKKRQHRPESEEPSSSNDSFGC